MHDHTHPHAGHDGSTGPGAARPDQRKALLTAFVITGTFVFVEVAAGLVFNSLALAADAAHLVSDAFALALALIAQSLASRPASPRHSFGWRRAEVMAAQVNGLLLVVVSLWIAFEAIGRFRSPQEINAGGVLGVAALGLLANLTSTYILHRVPGHNLNVRAAMLHTVSDAAGSVGVLLAGAITLVWGSTWADPLASLGIALLVIISAVRLLVDTSHVLLEGTPRHLDADAVEAALVSEDAVLAVHDLHLWTISSEAVALSAHIELEGPTTLHDAQAESIRLKEMLATRFGVSHSTLELECHPCEPDQFLH